MKEIVVLVLLVLAGLILTVISFMCAGSIEAGLLAADVKSYALLSALIWGFLGVASGYSYWDDHRDGWV